MLGQPLLGLFLGHFLKEFLGHSLAGKFSRFSIEVCAKITNNVSYLLDCYFLFMLQQIHSPSSFGVLISEIVILLLICCELRLDFVTRCERKHMYGVVELGN